MSSLAEAMSSSLSFHVSGELQIEDLGKLLDQQVVDRHAQIGGVEPPFLLLDVAAVLDRLDDRAHRCWAGRSPPFPAP